MVEETMINTASHVGSLPEAKGKTQASEAAQPAAVKTTATRAAGKPAGKQQRLIIHLGIGFLMTVTAISGYAFFGPGASANAASLASQRMVNIVTNNPAQITALATTDGNLALSDMAALQAEMDELTRQMSAIRAQGLPDYSMSSTGSSTPSQASSPQSSLYNDLSGNSPDPMQARLEQMMATTHEMIAKMNSVDVQTGGMTGTGSQPGGVDHH